MFSYLFRFQRPGSSALSAFRTPPLPRTLRNMSTQKTSHMERTAAEPRARELFEVRLAKVDQVNERVRLFQLELFSGSAEFFPGQWLDTFTPDTPKAGGFTITSPPSAAATGPKPCFELAVQESFGNPPAAWLWKPFDKIMDATLKVRIGGSFIFPPPGRELSSLTKVVFVGGGMGVNPLMSMLSYIGENSEDFKGLDVKMVYASKVPPGGVRDIVFLDRITRLFGEGKVKGEVSLFATGRDAHLQTGRQDINGAGVEVHGRRLTLDDLRSVVGSEKEDRESTVVYICGPPTMTDGLVESLTSADGLGMDPNQVLTEKWW